MSGLWIHYGEFQVNTVRMPVANPIPGAPLSVSQFPDKLIDAHGEVRKPARW